MGTAAAFVTDKAAGLTCSQAGIATMKGRLFELQQLNRAINANIAEADTATSEADLIRSVVLGLKLTKASCDAVIGVLGELTGPQGKAISAGYSGITPLAEAGGKAFAGQNVGAGGWLKAGAAGINGAVKTYAPTNPYADVIEMHKLKTDIVVDAVNQDTDKLIKDIGMYGAKMAEMTAKAAGRKVLASIISAGKKLVAAGADYVSAYKEFKASDLSATMEAAKRSFRMRQTQVQQMIAALDAAIRDCQLQLQSQPVFQRPRVA